MMQMFSPCRVQQDQSSLLPDTGSHPGLHREQQSDLPNFLCIYYVDEEVLLTSAKKLVCIRFLFISPSLMFISQISAADWGQAETTYNLYEVLFKVHKVSYEKDAVMCIRAVQILITSVCSL